MQNEQPSVFSFTQGTRKKSINERLLAATRAENNRHNNDLTYASDRSGLGRFLQKYYDRTRLPDLKLLAEIDTSTIKSQNDEIVMLNMMGTDVSPEKKQIQIYRIMLAGIAEDAILPITQNVTYTPWSSY
jgi:hypothetical protein